MTVPSNLVPTSITQLPVAPNPTSSATMVCVIGGITYQVSFIDLQSTVSVPASREINTGGGLQGGGDLSANRTLSIATGGVTSDKLAVSGVTAGTYGSGASVPVVTVSSKGLVTGVTEAPLVISGYVPDTRQIIAGAGLTGGGNLQANRTLAIDFSATAPAALGSASAGSASNSSRGDHVHPALNFANQTEYTGLLPLTHGGTGMQVNNLTAGAVWYSDGSNGFLQTVQGSNGQVLVSGGASAPTWGSALVVSAQPANYVYAGPTSGPDATTAFRLLVNDDIPSTLTGKTMDGSLNTFSNIPNVALDNYSVTFNGTTVDLGGSGTITATATNALTIGTGLSGSSYNGSTAVTIAIDNTVATLTGNQTLTNKTISGSSNTLSNIGNSSLTNSAITIGSNSVSLGGTITALAGVSISGSTSTLSDIGNSSLTNSSVTINGNSVSLGGSTTVTSSTTNALTIGTGLSGASFNGSSAVTVAIDSTVATLTGTQTLTGKTISGSDNTLSNIANSSLTNSSVTLGTTTTALGATSLTLAGLTSVTVTQDPVASLDLATKQYVDEVAEGLRAKPSARAATTTNLAAIYDNGASGVGATLTADTDRAFTTLDGVTGWAVTTPYQGVLVKNQTDPAYNGRYNLTSLGEAGVSPWVLTRCSLCDTAAEIPGAYTFVVSGTVNGGTGWVQTVADPATFVVGTDAITVVQFSGAGTYTAGNGLTLTGTQFSLTSPVSIANGGTNGTETPTAGAVPYGTGTAYSFSLAGTTGDFLISGGTGAPTWTSTISGGTYA